MSTQFMTLEYEKIKNDYNLQLTSKLRDFGESHLQYWIPEDDIILSLSNLFFSLSESDYLNSKIKLKKSFITKDIEKKIKDNFKIFAEIDFSKKDEFFLLKVTNLNKSKLKNFLDDYFINYKKVEVSLKIIKKKKIDNLDLKDVAEKIKKKYIIEKLDKTFKIEIDQFKKNIKSYDYYSENNGYGICVLIKNKIIHKINFYGHKDKLQNFILDKFCSLVVDKPIMEAYEHGIIKLEFELRNESILKEINGIMTGLVLSPIFETPKKLIKLIWKKYKDENSVEVKNLYDYNLSKKWLKFTYEEKIYKIKEIIEQFKLENTLYEKFDFDNLHDDNIRITIKFYENENDILKSQILLNFEKYIRIHLDKRLEIFYKELKDSNKLRIKNLKS